MPEYLAPAVYVEEVDTGSLPIEGVSVSVAGMVGVTERGPVGVPILITSFDGFARWFGQRLDRVAFSNASGRHCVISPTPFEGFFLNGGQQLFVTRVLDMTTARHAETTLFGRAAAGAARAAATVLLRPAPERTGAAVSPPSLYVLDNTGIAIGEWLRIGDGTQAEYRQVSAVGASAANTHVPVNFPLAFAHDRQTPVRELQWTSMAGNFTLADPVERGVTSVTVTGPPATAAADIGVLATDGARGGLLLEIGSRLTGGQPDLVGEHHFTLPVDPPGPNATRLTVPLASPLARPYPSGTTVVRLDPAQVAPAFSSTTPPALQVGATAGDRFMFVDNKGNRLGNRRGYAFIGREDDPRREVRRLGAPARLTLTSTAYDAYPAPSIVQAVGLNERGPLVAAPPPSDSDWVDVAGSVADAPLPGQTVRLGAQTLTVQSVTSRTPATTRITFTAPLAGAPAANARVAMAAELAADAQPGSTVLTLANRVGLAPDLLVRVGEGGTAEYLTLAAIPSRAPGGTPPDAGDVIFSAALSQPHPAGTPLTLLQPPAPVAARQPTATVLDVGAGTAVLIVTDGQGYQANESIAVHTPGGTAYYHRLDSVLDRHHPGDVDCHRGP